jgi:hypothetical protein
METLVELNAGDYIDLRSDPQTPASHANHTVSVYRLSGPAQIAMSEKVYLQYTGNGGTSLTASVTNIDFSTEVEDSHGAWNGTVFTAPRPGWYDAKGSIVGGASVAGMVSLYKSGSQFVVGCSDAATDRRTFSMGVYLQTGEQATFRLNANQTLVNSATVHWIAITSQG